MAEPYDGSRPYAVMINNIQVAMPQCGTSKADIIYEVLAEGGITRMMAIFSQLEGDTPIGLHSLPAPLLPQHCPLL